MFRFLAHLPARDRREALWASLALFLVLVAHGILETARDTLFLAHLPSNRLPWVYLSLAGLALLVTRLLALWRGRATLATLLVIQVTAGIGTLAFVGLTSLPRDVALYALYIWGGLASTLILFHFWLFLTDRFTPSQAKQIFPAIAVGPIAGSLVGYGAAGLLSQIMAPRAWLAVSGAVFLLSAAGSAALGRSHAAAADESAPGDAAGTPPVEEAAFRDSLWLAFHHPYVRRVTLLLLLASITVTIADFVFKSVVARAVPAAHLGAFLAISYFGFDLASLVLLLVAVVPFVRRFGVTRALAVQPLLMLAGGTALTMSGGLAAVLCLRGTDGALRWSLHKTASELLYVPMPPRLRAAVKAISDIVAHRGGQAIGSLLILSWLAATRSEQLMGPVVVACAAIWVYLAASLRQPYLDLFRETLGRGAIETRLEFPDLDMASLETLIAALSSTDDDRVVAAMELLERTERAHLVPPLILYHPSAAIVVRALDLFTRAARADVAPLVQRLLSHADSAVRAAAMRAVALLDPGVDQLERAAATDCPAVAVTALVALAAAGKLEGNAAREQIESRLRDAPADVAYFAARALRDHPVQALAPLLTRLVRDGDTETGREALRAMGELRSAEHLPEIVALLARRELRDEARTALLAFGEPALDHLARALDDPSLPRPVRLHLPRTISRFPGPHAASLLVRHLAHETSGTVRFKILRGLGRMAAEDPTLRLDDDIVDAVIERQLTAIFQSIHWRLLLDQGRHERSERATIGHTLLVDLLHEREALGSERLFRALGLRYRKENLGQIHAGLQSPDAAMRSSSRELLNVLLPRGLREAVVGITEELPDAERLAAGDAYYTPEALGYDALLGVLVEQNSPTLASIAAYHAAELGLSDFRSRLEDAAPDGDAFALLRRRGLSFLEERAPAHGVTP